MAFDPFAAPLLKIKRAKQHISDLNGQINAYMAKKPFQLIIRQYPELAELHALVETRHPIPAEFPLLLGDAIHNLRSSLDLMIFGLIGDKVAMPDSLYFPMCKRAGALKDAITRRQMHLAGESVVRAIETLQPYPEGKYGLYSLHELDIRDKHRLILAAWRNAEIKAAELKKIHPLFDFNRHPNVTFNFMMDPDKPVLAAVRFTPTDLPDDRARHQEVAAIQPTFTMCFDKGHSLASQPIIPALDALVANCESAIAIVRAATL